MRLGFDLSTKNVTDVINDYLPSCLLLGKNATEDEPPINYCVDPKSFPVITELFDKFFDQYSELKNCRTSPDEWSTHYTCTKGNSPWQLKILNLELDPLNITITALKSLHGSYIRENKLECSAFDGMEVKQLYCFASPADKNFYTYQLRQLAPDACIDSYNSDPLHKYWDDAERTYCVKGLPLFDKFFNDRTTPIPTPAVGVPENGAKKIAGESGFWFTVKLSAPVLVSATAAGFFIGLTLKELGKLLKACKAKDIVKAEAVGRTISYSVAALASVALTVFTYNNANSTFKAQFQTQ